MLYIAWCEPITPSHCVLGAIPEVGWPALELPVTVRDKKRDMDPVCPKKKQGYWCVLGTHRTPHIAWGKGSVKEYSANV